MATIILIWSELTNNPKQNTKAYFDIFNRWSEWYLVFSFNNLNLKEKTMKKMILVMAVLAVSACSQLDGITGKVNQATSAVNQASSAVNQASSAVSSVKSIAK